MPSMANITVKAANGTTDVVYTGVSPSSGDNVPAIWRNESAGTAAAFKPTLNLSFKDNGPKTARRMASEFKWPQTATDTTTGLTSVVNTGFITISGLFPKTMPQATVDEIVHQATNLFASTLYRDCLKSGYSAT